MGISQLDALSDDAEATATASPLSGTMRNGNSLLRLIQLFLSSAQRIIFRRRRRKMTLFNLFRSRFSGKVAPDLGFFSGESFIFKLGRKKKSFFFSVTMSLDSSCPTECVMVKFLRISTQWGSQFFGLKKSKVVLGLVRLAIYPSEESHPDLPDPLCNPV